MKVLSVNTGSATIKYGLFDADTLAPLARGQASGIGAAEGRIEHQRTGAEAEVRALTLPDHRDAVARLLAPVTGAPGQAGELAGVGHRVVHGGTSLTAPVRVDDAVVAKIRALGRLAPLHNLIAADGLEIARELLPDVQHVAVFDTAFHARLPAHARRYAIPERYTERGFRRFGFHGISHGAAAARAAAWIERPPADLRIITLHLGNGASATAVRGGQSVDTSMGMTPLEGLVMGTRSGDVDPAAALRMAVELDMAPQDVEAMLTRDSGLRALAGTHDMRVIEARAAAGDAHAREALELFCYRVKKYVGAYMAVLGGLDALVFTGGIGENSATVRAGCCAGLGAFGIELDPAANTAHRFAVHAGSVPVLVVPADEERAIARAVRTLVAGERTPEGLGPE